MADTKISALPSRTSLVATDQVTTLSGGVNYRSPLSSITALMPVGGSTPSAFYETAVGAGSASVIASIIPVGVKTIVTGGYNTVGRGAAIYHRIAGLPSPGEVGPPAVPADPKYPLMLTPAGTPPSTQQNRGIIRSADFFTLSGTTDATDGGYWMLNREQGITPQMFGATADNVVDDGPAVRHAHHFCRWARAGEDKTSTGPISPNAYIPLRFPVGRYRIDSSYLAGSPIQNGGFPLCDNMIWVGEGGYGDEKDQLSQIRYSLDDMFHFGDVATGDDRRDWIAIIGLSFDGRSPNHNMLTPANPDITAAGSQTNPILFNSVFAYCGFKNFHAAFDNLLSGCRINNCFFQNCQITFKAAGADNIIIDNYMSGSNWNQPSGNNSLYGQDTFAIWLGSWRLCRFDHNFVTGRPQMIMKCNGSLDASIFDANWFDICDWSALNISNSRGGIFVNNTFNNIMYGIDPALRKGTGPDVAVGGNDAIIRINDSHNFTFAHNNFSYLQATGPDKLPNDPADVGHPNAHSPLTFHITGSVPGATHDIKIVDNNYCSDYKFSMNFDAEAGPPDLVGEPFPHRRTSIYGYTDCLAPISIAGGASTPGGTGDFVATVTGTGADVASVTPWDQHHPGVLRLNLGTTTTGAAAITTSSVPIRLGVGEASCYFVAKELALSDGTNTFTVRMGFLDTAVGVATNGVFFRYTHSVNSGKWEAVCRAAGVETVADTGITFTVGEDRNYRIFVNMEGTSASFYIDGLPKIAVPITSNIPTLAGLGVGVGAVKSAGTTSTLVMDVDMIEYEKKILQQR